MPGNIISSPASKGGMGIEIDMLPPPVIIAGSFASLAGAFGGGLEEPLKKSVVDVIAPSIGQNFDTGGRPTWAPLADRTKMWCKRLAKAHEKVLEMSGALAAQGGQPDEWNIQGDTASMGISEDIWYGAIHEDGNATTPQREWANYQDQDISDIEDIFGGWVQDQVEDFLWP